MMIKLILTIMPIFRACPVLGCCENGDEHNIRISYGSEYQVFGLLDVTLCNLVGRCR